ncbi:MAG TPA: ferritin family protein [bacterium]|nr:ferritin family protein [bacterium]
MAMFKPDEIYQFALKIEENGEKFYRKVSARLANQDLKDLFEFLADEEVKHKETFQAMLADIQDYKPSESYPGEYFKYLKAYADNLIFSMEKLEDDINKIEEALPAVDYAIKKELDTIAYYREMQTTVPESEVSKIEKIIAEERKHVVKLSELKEKLS